MRPAPGQTTDEPEGHSRWPPSLRRAPMSTPTPAVPPAAPSQQPAPAAPPPAPRRRLLSRLLWLGGLLGLAGLATPIVYSWWSHRLTHSITDDAFVEAHIVNVAPEMVSGRLVRFLVEENDRVEQGQVLAEVEPIHYRDQVEQARGKLDLAEAELKRQQAGLAKLKKEVPLQVDVAKRTLDGARTEEARAKDALKLTTDE